MAHSSSQAKKATASGWIGSALEYYDFFIYAQAAALIFPQIFFPNTDPKMAIIASLATYGVGYLARPIGAFVLGHWGDTRGRKNVLLLCMFLMGLSTMAVGLLPTYHDIGYLAPALLVVLRLIQGFAVAGEISGASSMIMEHAPFGRRGYYASFTLQGVQAGQVLAAAVFLPLAYFMPSEAFTEWGWRIPFLMSAIVLIAGFIIRKEVHETPAFVQEEKQDKVAKSPISEGNIVAVLVIQFVGNLSDKIGRRPTMIAGCLGSGLLAFVYLYAISIQNVPMAFAASIVMWGMVYQGYNAVFPSFYPELFHTRYRVTAMAIAQNIGTMLTAMLPALFAMVAPPGSDNIPLVVGGLAFFITGVCALAAYIAPETHRLAMDDLGNPDAKPMEKAAYEASRKGSFQAVSH